MTAIATLALAIPALAFAQAQRSFPGADPHESPRANTPDDPEFDRCEPDDPDEDAGECSIYEEEQYGSFGFSPESANEVPGVPHSAGATRYRDCSQLDAQGRAANTAVGDPECAQLSGVRADTAWKYSTGDPEVVVAILDTGIRWQARDLVNKIALNADELPRPRAGRKSPLAGSTSCSRFRSRDDANRDGAFDVRDFACDPRVAVGAGDSESDEILDASDLIATFSKRGFSANGVAGGRDDDDNGYTDDIAGWDFFDDDNDPFDASSCCSASGHGTGRAAEAAAETDNGVDETGMCPECQVMPLRVWDSFVVPGDLFAMGVVYAAENGASVIEGAVGGLSNTQFARRAFELADSRGVALTMVSSDINSANHNYPTNYNEAIYVGGAIYDTAPNETCSGPGGIPGVGSVFDVPSGFEDGCEQFLDALRQSGVAPHAPGQPVTTSFFRNSNLTQYGGKADIVLMGSTGSVNTGQASGAAGLLASFGRKRFGSRNPLSGNEIRQLLTMSAEQVLPANTGVIGHPDKANPGWDPHFGYGRVNLAAAMARIVNDRGPRPAAQWPCADRERTCVPPEAQLDAPDWFTPINVDRLPARGVVVTGRAAAPHSDAGVGAWELEYACGQDALDTEFKPLPGARGRGPADGRLGRISKDLLGALAESCDGSVANDPGRPAGTSADPWPADPYPQPDPERHAFQIRLTVHEADDPANFGRYRKTLFAYRDDGNLRGWPRPIGRGSDAGELITGSGGEVPPRLYDLDGDNALDVILPTSSGELYVLDSKGKPLRDFNRGRPVRTKPLRVARRHPQAGLRVPRESPRAPAIGDIDGDRAPEIVATAGEHVYAWNDDGSVVRGFPVRIDPKLSRPCKRGVSKPCFDAEDRAITPSNHIKRGFMGAVALADLDDDGRLDAVAGSLDQHVYAWDGKGRPLRAARTASARGNGRYPVKLESAGAVGAEIVTSPAIADLDGDGSDEVVLATNEVIDADPPDEFPAIVDLFDAVLASSAGSNPIYAINGDGSSVPGWPATIGVAAGDLLPLVLPGHDAAVLDVDGNGDDEVSLAAGSSLGSGQGTRLVDGDGTTIRTYDNGPVNGADQGPVFNVADYASLGDALGTGVPQVFKGGLSLNGAVNLLAVNQNLPFNHLVQGWDPASGSAVAGFPRATDDFQLVSQPAVGRVWGEGPSRQVLYGTGLYQLHAYGADGSQPAGSSWPKFTGGWTQATPSIGDADGDGDLDVAAQTREGWSFLWDTGQPACEDSAGTTNDEWWTFHHDEHGSANYAGDGRPPGAATGLEVRRRGGGAIRARWVTPGGDWLCGRAERFQVLVSDRPIETPRDGKRVLSRGAGEGGERQKLTLGKRDVSQALRGSGRPRFLAVLYRDEAGNWGSLASKRLPGAGREREQGKDRGDRPSGGGGPDLCRRPPPTASRRC